jgi:hypothetical protein
MAWITPKTNWVANDKIGANDYNRIANNLLYLVKLGNRIGYPISHQVLDGRKKYSSIPYPSTLNALENSLENINSETFNFDIGETKTYVANGHPFDYIELNRLESAILKIYQQLSIQRDTLMHYPQQFNGSNIYKVARVHYVEEEPIAYRLEFRLGNRKGVI